MNTKRDSGKHQQAAFRVAALELVWVIAKHEFWVTVTRKTYIFALIGMPLLFGGIFSVSFLTTDGVQKSIKLSSKPIAVIDRSGVVDFKLVTAVDEPRDGLEGTVDALRRAAGVQSPRIVPYSNLDVAIHDIRQGNLSAVYLIEADYMTTGKIVAYSPERGLFSDLSPPDRSRLYEVIRASLIKGRIEGEARDRLLTPARLEQLKVSKRGEVQEDSESFQKAARFFGPFSMFLLLTMAIFFSSGYLLQGIAEEKQNRVIELIWSAVDPRQLLLGKIIGLGAAGLLQVAFYAVLLFFPAMTLFSLFEVSLAGMLLSLLYFILGYLLFAGLMAATGILGNSPQESGQLSAFWTLVSMIPMFVLAPITEDPNSWLARGLSWFPLTAPVTMLLRVTSAQIPWTDVGISCAVLMISIYFAVNGAAKMFRAAALMYGKRPGISEIWRWLREA